MAKKLFTAFGRSQANAAVVLASGGVDSSILLALEAEKRKTIIPVFIRTGLRFEREQKRALERFLRKLRKKNIRPIVELPVATGPFFPAGHWAVSGRGVPSRTSPTGSVYLPGWNLFLLTPAVVFASQQGISTVVLGHLAHNPYPDGRPQFFRAFERLAEIAFNHRIKIERPFEKWDKKDILKKGRVFPLELTLTCVDPVRGRHCGECNKCAERHAAFSKAGLKDPTVYTSERL